MRIEWGNCFSVLSIIISFVSLAFSIFVYNRSDFQQVQSKQVDAVTRLVEYIHNTPLKITKVICNIDGGNSVSRNNFTLFELEDAYCKNNSSDIYLSDGEPYPIDFLESVFNPLISKEIADMLKCYHSHKVGSCGEESILRKKSSVRLSNLKFIDQCAASDSLPKRSGMYYSIY